MSDLIERQTAIDGFYEMASNMDYLCTVSDYVSFLESLPSVHPDELTELISATYTEGFDDGYGRGKQDAQRWIPCNERLPEKKRKTYWVCTDTEYQCECRWTNNRFGLGESDNWGWSYFDTPQYTEVITWMPLPEPYKRD